MIPAGSNYIYFTETAPRVGQITQTASAPGWTSGRAHGHGLDAAPLRVLRQHDQHHEREPDRERVRSATPSGGGHYRIDPLLRAVTSSDTTIVQIVDTLVDDRRRREQVTARYKPGGFGGVAWVRFNAGGHIRRFHQDHGHCAVARDPVPSRARDRYRAADGELRLRADPERRRLGGDGQSRERRHVDRVRHAAHHHPGGTGDRLLRRARPRAGTRAVPDDRRRLRRRTATRSSSARRVSSTAAASTSRTSTRTPASRSTPPTRSATRTR